MRNKVSAVAFLVMVFMAIWILSAAAKQEKQHRDPSATVDEEFSLAATAWSETSTLQDTIFFEDFEPIDPNWTHGDIRETNGLIWHTDTFNAYTGKSWWCGHPDLQGYRDNWYQVLTTPSIDLSNTSTPILSFMHFYATEYDSTEPPEGNPWDGCHVRCSTDGGQTYTLIEPKGGYDPPDSLWVWEWHYEALPGGMPGWHGFSNGWKPATFDLAQFAGQVIELRFIFASDAAWDTRDDERLLGWFLDDITVKDGSSVLFFDDGEDTVVPSQFVLSEGSGLYPSGWTENTSEYHSPTRSWHCDDTYNILNVLVSPWISLPEGEGRVSLTYWLYADMPDYDGDGDNKLEDYYRVEISLDGLIWEKLIHDYARPEIGADRSWVQMKPGLNYNGTLELNQWKGQEVKLRWFAITDDNDDGGSGSGLYLDDILIAGQLTPTSPLPFGGYLVLDGDNDYAEALDHPELDVGDDVDESLTIEAWVKFQTDEDSLKEIQIVSKSNAYSLYTTESWQEWVGPIKLTRLGFGFKLSHGGYTEEIFHAQSISGTWISRWHHIAGVFVRATGDMILYVDGERVSGPLDIGQITVNNSSRAVKVRANSAVLIDEVRISSNVRYVGDTYPAPSSPFESDDHTRALWHFNESNGSIEFHDAGGVDNVLIGCNGAHTVTHVSLTPEIPQEYQLFQNYPNPFNPKTTIRYQLPKPTGVTLQIYNLMGELVTTLVDEYQSTGNYKTTWNGKNQNGLEVASGVYFYSLITDDFVISNKMVLAR